MGRKIIEKIAGAVQHPEHAEERIAAQNHVGSHHPKALSPRDRIVVPATREELNALISGAPEGSLLKDPRLCGLVNGIEEGRHIIPDWRLDLFSWAAVHLPGDVTEMLDRMNGLYGPFQDPRKTVAEFLERQRNFSFCIHPLTGDALIAGTQKGHPQMFNEAQVPMDVRSRFCLGAVYLREGTMVVDQHAGLTLLNSAESNNVTLRILREDLGIPFDLSIHDQAPDVNPAEVLFERRRTPRGQLIPRWDAASPDTGVVFEGNYCYTAVPVPTKDYLHVKTAAALQRVAEEQPFEVFNNAKVEPGRIDISTLMDHLNPNVVEPRRGKFVNAELLTLGDSVNRQVTGGSPEPLLIVRVAEKLGKIPPVFSKIAKAVGD
jgi:hypothetical protein